MNKFVNLWWTIVSACLKRSIVMLSWSGALLFIVLIAFSVSLSVIRGNLYGSYSYCGMFLGRIISHAPLYFPIMEYLTIGY